MQSLEKLFAQNRAWSERVRAENPEFFSELARQQAPEYLWIGCADSRVPANQIVGLMPGEVFVHRNVANVVAHSDLNCCHIPRSLLRGYANEIRTPPGQPRAGGAVQAARRILGACPGE